MFKKLWRKFKRLFRKTEDRTAPTPTTQPTLRVEETGSKILGILMFTGHHESDGGTVSYNGISEMPSNRMTAERLKKKWTLEPRFAASREVVLETAYRRKKGYSAHCRDARKQVKAFAERLGCEPKNILVIELHYNSAGVRLARGGYFMVEKGDSRAVIAGKILIDHFVAMTPMTTRKNYMGHDGIEGMTSGNGFGFIDYCNDDGAISLLFEPLFCDFMNSETEWLFGEKDLNYAGKTEQMEFIAARMSSLWMAALIKVLKRFNG